MMLRLFRSRKLRSRCHRALTAFVGILVIVCAPVVPVIQVSTPERGPRLGVEVQMAHADPFGNGYTYRRSITIQESQVTGGSALTNFPVLISLAEPDLRTTGSGGKVTDSQGDDIIFTSDSAGSTVLDFEVERYTDGASEAELTAWVEVPSVDNAVNTVIYMFYGNSTVTTSQEDVPGTWDGNYIGVYHMDGDASTQLDSADASVSQDGTVSGATAGVAGKIGPAYDFDGVNDVITVTDQAELDVTNTGTFEAWMRTDDVSSTESSFASWVSRNAPNGAGADTQSGHGAVIVGENVHLGLYLCTGTTEDFAVASTSLSGNRFDNWDISKIATPTGACQAGEGAGLGMDSDGVHIYYLANTQSGTTEGIVTATATVSYSASSAWRTESAPNLSAGDNGNNADVVIVGNTAYYDIIQHSATTEGFSSTTRALGSGAALSWVSNTATNFGANTGENCSNAVDSDGYKLYRSIYCHDAGTETYNMSSTTIGAAGAPTWRTQTAPNGADADDNDEVDMVLMGGRLYHFAALHAGATEAYLTASSSPETGGALSWVTGAAADGAQSTDTITAEVVSDGKNLFYSVFIASSTERFFTSSSTLPAHPFMSKRDAYEMIQIGTGFAFDWAGRPYTFGTSTNTTGFKHIVVTQDGTTLNMYEDGVLRRSQTTSVDFASNANNLLIGQGNRSDGTSIWFNGLIDEVRVSNSARSTDWIQTEYNNQNATSTFYTLGFEDTVATVQTNFASNVSGTSAKLNGRITSAISISEHGFAYSTDSTLVTSVSTTTLGSGSVGEFSSNISSLTADTTYYFRAYANSNVGAIISFFTGNANVTRTLRLFEGATVKFRDGRIKLYPR